MKNKGLVALSVLAMFSVTVACAENKKEESYNYKRGVELLLEEGDLDRGLEYLQKEVKDHKSNGYAYLWIGRTYYQQKKYGQALDGITKAIKFLGKDDEKLAIAYYHRALTYQELGEEDKMLNDLTASIKYNPEELTPYKVRGDVYFNQENYDLAEKDYNQVISLSPGDVYGHLSLGQTSYMRKEYDKAIEKYDYVLKLDPEYYYAKSFRAEAFFSQNKYEESLTDIMDVLQRDHKESFAGEVFNRLADTIPTMVLMKLKVQMKKTPFDYFWPVLAGSVCASQKQYKEAILWYQKAYNVEPAQNIAGRLAECYEKIGNNQKALFWTNCELAMDSTNVHLLSSRIVLEDNMGMQEDAMQHVNELIDMYPDFYFGYYRRGWMKDKNHISMDDAIDDYTIAIDLNPKIQYNFLARGQVYGQQGKLDLAKADFQRCLDLDSISHDNVCTMYASYYLGDTAKTMALKDSILKEDRAGSCYDVACLYSLMDSTSLALQYLRESFENGQSNFAHARRDQDLANIQKLPEFEALLQEYEKRRTAESTTVEEEDGSIYEEEKIEVPIVKDGNLYSVKCSINSLPLHFVFDTGASDVCISSVEATFMLKNGYLSQDDITGKAYYMTANGDISEGTMIRLREVNFGGLVLKDVNASVSKSQKAPLLLGQTVLQRLGKIEIDNERKILRVTQIRKKKDFNHGL